MPIQPKLALTDYAGMLSRVVVRCASRASFNLQPVTFKHGQQSPASQDAPVITRPVEHEDKGKHRQDGSDQVHQGVCCDVSSLPFTTLEEDYMEQRDPSEGHSQQGAAAKRHELWLYLDNIQDPMNFGAVLRSAYFMGVSRVITSNTNSVKVTNTVSKASAGVAEIFPVHQVEDPVKLASSLTSAGWEVISSSSPGSGDNTSARLTNVTTFTPKSSILLIVGNEGKGITPELQQMCHTVVNIAPGRTLHPHLQCLNVSVATALLLHSLRQRLDAVQTLDGPTHLER
ncbi:rRNA methyltransferase 1, mitochondrial [Chionoecetes opilio]|uniref:rRNA methyltransferase 1, mitochondrial n=1 Tax=Chionoecetes opilio TaxID=41210 RepID=A0A8J4YJL1_CHIOP|nr:rRNA methyltransferase 1, mitochondrial [Chionoecetes opilio]